MRSLLIAAALCLAATPAAAQTLTVSGAGRTVQVTAAELAALPHEAISVTVHDKPHVYDGVPLSALLAKVGAPAGEKLRGAELTNVVRVTASDGYQVVLSLAETDAAVRKGRVLVVDREDGKPLAADGPFRLVVEGDLKPARSARSVVRLEVLKLATETKK